MITHLYYVITGIINANKGKSELTRVYDENINKILQNI